jgi:hypothetical protein
LAEAALRAGYYDQSHMAKDVTSLTGESPAEYFSRPRAW